jgi:hypothetical protein
MPRRNGNAGKVRPKKKARPQKRPTRRGEFNRRLHSRKLRK